MAVIFHRLAAQEFVRVRQWYGRRSARVEADFVAAVGAAVTFTEANPFLAPTYQGNYRWQRVRGFPYILYFEPIAAGTVYVYAVAHASRRPGYWMRRVHRP